MAHYEMSSSFLGVVLSVRVAFSKRSWPYLVAAAVPWLVCAGQRTITRVAKLAGRVLLPVIERYRDRPIPKYFRGDAAFAVIDYRLPAPAGGGVRRDSS